MEALIKQVIIKPRKERRISFKSILKHDYKVTWEAYKEAREKDDKEAMKSLYHDLVMIADRMECEE